ncbi:RNA 2',3'-cyclic phosphodiesterase [Streptosporangium sp. NPDC006007]|uniref:RNA 2',3'-cyclic phosphodiesterase n=1 Tax=Streptosporangium sp. NPDC006007 TaxID=3154575 RepID=UPI0033A62CA9
MRLFVGVLPPWRARDELTRALGPHRAAWPALRWLDPANWHVTLSFLGEVPEEILPELDTRLARAAARQAPMTLSFAGAGAFPSARQARVLWAGVYGPRPRLIRLAGSLGAGARRAGAVQTDRRQLRPHLTLARSRTDVDVRDLVETFEAFAGTAWEARAVHLVRSRLGPVVRYEPIAEYALSASAPGGRS